MQGRNIKNLINSIFSSMLFIAVIIVLPIYFYITNDNVKYEIDLGEKRELKTEIEVADPDKYFAAVEDLYNDHIPYRSIIISLNRYINDVLDTTYKTYLEKPFRDIRNLSRKRIISVDEDLQDGETYMDKAVDYYYGRVLEPDDIDPYDNEVEFPIKQLSDKVILGQSDWMYLKSDNISYYKGTNIFKTDDEYENYIRNIGMLNDICKEKGKQLIILICPEKEEIYSEYMPTMEIKDEEELPIKIKKYIEENTDITYLYPKEAILSEKDKYRLYKKYDSHWNKVGAYIAVTEIYKKLGMKYTPIEELRVERIPETLKDLAFLGNVNADNYTDSFEYIVHYKDDAKVTMIDKGLPKGTSDMVSMYQSNTSNYKSLFFYGDSYRLNMVDFMNKDFENSTFMQREADFTKTLVERLKESDVIIIEEVERNSGNILIDMVVKLQKALIKK